MLFLHNKDNRNYLASKLESLLGFCHRIIMHPDIGILIYSFDCFLYLCMLLKATVIVQTFPSFVSMLQQVPVLEEIGALDVCRLAHRSR